MLSKYLNYDGLGKKPWRPLVGRQDSDARGRGTRVLRDLFVKLFSHIGVPEDPGAQWWGARGTWRPLPGRRVSNFVIICFDRIFLKKDLKKKVWSCWFGCGLLPAVGFVWFDLPSPAS